MKERERKKSERKNKKDLKQRIEMRERKVENTRERLKENREKTDNPKAKEGERHWETGGKIPSKIEPTEKRKREDEESDIETAESRLRKRKWGGGGDKTLERGKIRNLEEPREIEIDKRITGSSRTLTQCKDTETELNKHKLVQENLTQRHRVHSEEKINNLDLKRKIFSKKVQEKKWEGSMRGHFGLKDVSEPETDGKFIENGGGQNVETKKRTK